MAAARGVPSVLIRHPTRRTIMDEYVPAVIIGAGQAGLATSWWLTECGVRHVVL
jgi:cation diffusion facilitator CzcD-associated flavoprotein CzcO